jgi:hypothetical protein
VRFLTWLFGKKEQGGTTAPPSREAPAVATERPAPAPRPEKTEPPSEAENLRRWRDSGGPGAWVEARGGQWGHAEWLALLEELKRSPYWPMQPDAVGLALEEAQRAWLRRGRAAPQQ